MRLRALFEGAWLGVAGPRECGVMAGSDTPIVVRLHRSKIDMVTYCMKSCRVSDTESCRRVAEKSSWYGLVDGSHTLGALLLLRIFYPNKWAVYKWFVMVITRGHSMENYRQLAHMQNERHS